MEERLKRRLVGAVVLVLAVVIFVPMFLGTPHTIYVEAPTSGDSASPGTTPVAENERSDESDARAVERPAETVSIVRITSDGRVKHESTAAPEAVDGADKTQPAADDENARKEEVSVADKSIAEPAVPANDEKAAAADTASDEPPPGESARGEAESIETAENEPPEKDGKENASDRQASASPGGWVVQVGSFSDAKNAETMKERLRKNGYRVFTVSGRNAADNTRMTRVFVGSESSRKKANTLKARIESDERIGVAKGLVRPWPDEADKSRSQ